MSSLSNGSNSIAEVEHEIHQEAYSEGSEGDLFQLTAKFGLSKHSDIELHTKYSIERSNYFAFGLKQGKDLLFVFGSSATSREGTDVQWRLRHVPWFEDISKKISALCFDEEGTVYIGTENGTIYELNVPAIFNVEMLEPDLKQTFHLDDCTILDILIWFRDTTKLVMCNGGSGKFVVIPSNSLPVLITFNSPITTMHLFISNAGLSSLLVCLQNNQNVTTVLDDLDVPPHEESLVKKSIFRRAKENIISRFGDSDKNPIFGRKTSRDISSGQEIAHASESTTTLNAQVSVQLTPSSNNLLPTASATVINIKFTTLEELNSRGTMYKILGRNQFYRHIGTKLDIFEADFRQIASMSLPENISKLFVIEKIFYGVDEESQCIRLSVVHNQMLKEFAIVPMSSKVLSVEPAGEMGNMEPFSVFLICNTGIFLLALRKSPIDSCADLLMGEAAGGLFDVICTALNVAKNEVYILAGDKSAEEGKFAKTILYYKVSGMTYSRIIAKFGSRRMIPAMLCFYDLVENEKAKITGSLIERYVMADIILLGRIEQYLRHGTKTEPSKDPKSLLIHFLKSNEYYASTTAAFHLSYPELLWAARILCETRFCFSEVNLDLYAHEKDFSNRIIGTQFWNLVIRDWKAIYEAPAHVFCWYRELFLSSIDTLDFDTICQLCKSLLPWRRELLRKFFCDVSDVTESIDFTETPGTSKLSNDDYLNLFIVTILELLKRQEFASCRVSKLFFNWRAKKIQRKLLEENSKNPVATTLLGSNTMKTFSASSSHCVCIRNGRMYSWGENKFGRLGVRVNRDKFPSSIEIPLPVNLSPSLKLVVESVSCGQTHTAALSSAGTVLVFGSNKYGQLGVGKQCRFAESPLFPTLPSITFICVAAGGYHTVGVDHLNRPWTWGWGMYGQLGNGDIENKFFPTRIHVDEKVVSASAGHSHTALLTITGKVLTFGCAHFGQLGQGQSNVKLKTPKVMTLPAGVAVKSIECGLCSTICVTMRNRIFYAGINPSSIRSMLSGARKKAAEGRNLGAPVTQEPEEKDHSSPALIDTSHVAGDIVKVGAATTHFAVLTSTGMIYSWGLGKNGQLMRPDDDTKGLSLVDTEERVMKASNVVCAGECSWIVEKDSGRVFGYGFNSSGQLGKMEAQQESSILTIKTKKRVLRVRQPANVHYKGKEILGLPRNSSIAASENAVMPLIEISPPTDVVGQELLIWVLRIFHKTYSSDVVASMCEKYGNHEGAALVHELERDFESVLRHQMEEGKSTVKNVIADYIDTKERSTTCFQEYWMRRNLSGVELENILMPYYKKSLWNSSMSRALREMISETNDRSKWIASNFTPSFILACIRDSKLALMEENCEENEKLPNQGGIGKPSQNGVSATSAVIENGGDDMC